MKRFGFFCLLALTLITTASRAMCANIADVPKNHWANTEIQAIIESGLMNLNHQGEFRPNDSISRTDFVAALVKICDFNSSPLMKDPAFKDLNVNTRNLNEILTSQQMQVIFGYPDKTFKPEAATKRSEASSAVAHVVNSDYSDLKILNMYEDAMDIPEWALDSYVQNAASDLNINYPNTKKLEPNKNLTRAQTAVLFVKVYNYTKQKQNLKSVSNTKSKVKEEVQDNRIEEVLLRTETLDVCKEALSHTVEIYNTKAVIFAGNVLEGDFKSDLKVKKSNVGDVVRLVAEKDIHTVEGTPLYPAGTVFSGRVQRIKLSTWLERKHQALMVLDEVSLPNGNTFNFAGVPLTEKNRVLLTNKKVTNEDLYINYFQNRKMNTTPKQLVTFANKVSPKPKYKNKASDKVYILLTGDMVIQYIDPVLIKRTVGSH